jgi:protein gp37
MSDKTKIEWSDATWNPVVGCSIVSPGCTNCYAMRMAHQLEQRFKSEKYAGLTRVVNGNPVWTGQVRLVEEALDQPIRWRRPRLIFVNSMSDLFHEALPDAAIDCVFARMALASQHIYQILTKRQDRMRAYTRGDWQTRVMQIITDLVDGSEVKSDDAPILLPARLPNLWLGVSVEDQARADQRHDDLAAIAALGWTTWVSYEPALGPVDWTGWEFIEWLVSGGESGQDARPTHPDWHRRARDWCASAEVAYHLKQWGEWHPCTIDNPADGSGNLIYPDDETIDLGDRRFSVTSVGGQDYFRAGKKLAGRLLDGRTHDEFPLEGSL